MSKIRLNPVWHRMLYNPAYGNSGHQRVKTEHRLLITGAAVA